jgi:hypothetical protein
MANTCWELGKATPDADALRDNEAASFYPKKLALHFRRAFSTVT